MVSPVVGLTACMVMEGLQACVRCGALLMARVGSCDGSPQPHHGWATPRGAPEQKSYHSVASSAGERGGQLEPLGTVVQRQRKMLQKISPQQTIDGTCPWEGLQDTHLQVCDDSVPHSQSGDGHEWEPHLLPADHFEQTHRPIACGLQPGTSGRLGRQHGVGGTGIEEERDWL